VPVRSEEKSDDSKYDFYGELDYVFHHFHRHNIKNVLGNFMQKWEQRIFSNRQLRIEVYDYVRILMIVVLGS
jgi:hypothetical protein